MAAEVALPVQVSWLRKYEHLVGGFAGGIASTAVCHPMDLLKIRYSADEGSSIRPRYKSYFDATRCIVRAEGVRGLYQGLTPNMVGAALAWGLYLQWFELAFYNFDPKDEIEYHKIQEWLPFRSPNVNIDNFLCGCLSGGAVMAVTNPIWVTKTRLCLQYETKVKRYSGMLDCLYKISKEEGVRGLYRVGFPTKALLRKSTARKSNPR
ncbi:unnamed protein product [Strongylus vulgaris]|uniref:Mitochondrial carrier protein n=1 Tax=Strongylus vulgaris TaxID=40348 RepID=A0A3P7K2T1_STRVU|nr:unnamed protein product [Strongylus vulgaris]